MERTAKKPFFHRVGAWFARLGKAIAKPFKRFGLRFKNGSIYTKISYFLMGFGNLSRGQIGKGLVFLLIQIAFILLMILCPSINNTPLGYKAYVNIVTLGTNEGSAFEHGDNSTLMLLFGVMMIILTFVFIAVYIANTRSSEKTDQIVKKGETIYEYQNDMHLLVEQYSNKLAALSLNKAEILEGLVSRTDQLIEENRRLPDFKGKYVEQLDAALQKLEAENASEEVAKKELLKVIDAQARELIALPTFKDDLHSLLDGQFHMTMMVPAILMIVVFTLLPTTFMICVAFTNYDAAHQGTLFDWAGFATFVQIFNGSGTEISKMFFPVLGWTMIWAFIATFTNYFLGIFLALLINKKGVKAKVLWRTVFIMTIALPQFITLLAVRNILSNRGPINQLLINLGILKAGVEFLGMATNGLTARVTVLIINLWIGVPYTMLQTSGILMNIPKDLYEAATIDGANKWQMFRSITFPYIIFVTTPYLISSFVGNITSFNIIYLLTGGGPSNPGYYAGKTDLLVTWLYKLTMDQNEYNTAAVISIMTFIITATITLIFYSKSKAFNEEDSFQ